jgi:hypothetical protein
MTIVENNMSVRVIRLWDVKNSFLNSDVNVLSCSGLTLTLIAGSLFAMMHCGESVTYFLAPFVFSAIYASTLEVYHGLVFVVAFLLLIFPVAFTL